MSFISLTINGKETGMRFGIPALQRISKKLGITEFTEELSLTILTIRDIIYSGHLNYSMAKDMKPLVTAEEVYEYLENNLSSQEEYKKINEVIEFFNHSKYVMPFIPSENGNALEEEKKSL